MSMATDFNTPRSDWYDRRIGAPHDHRWSALACTQGFNLWGMTTLWTYNRHQVYPGDDETVVGILA